MDSLIIQLQPWALLLDYLWTAGTALFFISLLLTAILSITASVLFAFKAARMMRRYIRKILNAEPASSPA